jgi:hypothetical protein
LTRCSESCTPARSAAAAHQSSDARSARSSSPGSPRIKDRIGTMPAAAQSSTTRRRSTSSRMPFWLRRRTPASADSIPSSTR